MFYIYLFILSPFFERIYHSIFFKDESNKQFRVENSKKKKPDSPSDSIVQ